jgi:RNA polymerase sigma-70 factor (ECF subfamily)
VTTYGHEVEMEPMTEVRSESALYQQHQRELMRFATTLVGPSDAPDVVSSAMESLLKRGTLAQADNPRALMHRAVLRQSQSLHRSTFRRIRRERRFRSEVMTENPELRPDVVEAVLALSHQQRACVYLTYWNDFSAGQVAEWLHISEGSVKRHLARARANLREAIDE